MDKDLKVKGNKVYSPDTCLFIPRSVNSFFGGKHKKNDDDLPVGIVRAKGGFRLTVKHHSEIYETVEDAFHDWKIYAEGQRDRFLEEYDGKVPQEVLDAIEAYEFEITDR